MRTLITLTLLVAAFTGSAQKKEKFNTVEIKTSAVCDMCKEALEYEMALEKGVKSAMLDVDSKIMKVTYHRKRTDINTILERISKTGYDADSLSADPKAYEDLPECCRKGAHSEDHNKKH